MTDGEPLISVQNLKKYYPVRKGFVSRQVGVAKAVDGISFDIYPGETVGLVGESGCGKSTAAEAIIRLEEPTDGAVLFNGNTTAIDAARNGSNSLVGRLKSAVGRGDRAGTVTNDVTKFNNRQLKAFRRQAQMVMQDPSSSFNPRMTVGQSIGEMLLVHGMTDRRQRRDIVQDLLERVGLSASDHDRFPHEFSGGQKQRIGLARALVLNPEFIVADEPVSALDVSIQAEILSLIQDLQAEFGLSLLFISHDLSVIRQICDRVAVMYLGEIVEMAETETLFENPQHPYTEALLSSIPTPDPREEMAGIELTGEVPSPENPPSGCRFHTRCHRVIPPDGTAIEQSDWRAVLDFKIQVRQGRVDPDAIRDAIVSQDTSLEEPEEVGPDDFAAVVRNEYDVAGPLGDVGIEEGITKAIEALYDGDRERAATILAETARSPCELEVPAELDVGPGHRTACHLVERERTETSDAIAETQ